jgi:hypothetical protein
MTIARTVEITVQSKKQTEKGWALEVLCPSLGFEKYPLTIGGVPEADISRMVTGRSYWAVLNRGRLRQGKAEGSENSRDYWWDWSGLTSEPREADEVPEGEPVYGSAPPKPAEAPARARDPRDPHRASIERQVALKEARQAAEWFLSRSGLPVDAVVEAKAAEAEAARKLYGQTIEHFYHRFVRLLEKG